MTILEQILALLKLHGVEGSFDRIDVALAKLYEVETKGMAPKAASTQKVREDRRPKKEAKLVEDEHLGF